MSREHIPEPSVPAWAGAGASGRPQPGESTKSRPGFYLHPGQIFTSAEPYVVTTILGTCVAVCLWDPLAKLGGVNHYLLPYWVGEQDASPRYGNVAIEQLVQQVVALGGLRGRLQAKVFGGMCSSLGPRGPGKDLGTNNANLALKLLEDKEIPVLAKDLGGSRGRKLIFQVDDGTAWVKQL